MDRENKYKDFMNKKLERMVIEIDITKTEKTFNQLFRFIQKLESEKLESEKLEIKDIYFK